MDSSYIRQELKKLMHNFGNLSLHVTGEGKVDLVGITATGSTWMGMFKTIITGDTGCIYPLPGYDVTALDQVIDILLDIETRPHMNIVDNEKYCIDTESYKSEILAFKEEIKNDGHYSSRYIKEIKVNGVVVMVITIEPLVNEFVIGEYTAAQKNVFLGPIENYVTFGDDVCKITADSTEYEFNVKDLILYRDFVPKAGDYLLLDEERKAYVILPGYDYSIH